MKFLANNGITDDKNNILKLLLDDNHDFNNKDNPYEWISKSN